MGCTTHFLGRDWGHHSWRTRVTLAENMPKRETNMWGRAVDGEYTHCIKHDVCEVCGEARADISCLCDTKVGEHCAIRQAWLEEQRVSGS